MNRLTSDQLVQRRIREIRRKILHEYSTITRKIYKEHIEFLKTQIL